MRKRNSRKRLHSSGEQRLTPEEDLSYLAGIAPGYRRSELLELHREMMNMAELLIDFYLTKNQARQSEDPLGNVADIDK